MTRPPTLDLSLTASRWSAAWDPTVTPPTYPSTLPRSSPSVSSPRLGGTVDPRTRYTVAGPSRIPLGDITLEHTAGSGFGQSPVSGSSVGAFTQEKELGADRTPADSVDLEEQEEQEQPDQEKHEQTEITGIEDITDTQWAEAEEDRRKRKSSQASGSSGSGNNRDRDRSRVSRAPGASSQGSDSHSGSSSRVRRTARRSRDSRIDISSSVAVDYDEDMASPLLDAAPVSRRHGVQDPGLEDLFNSPPTRKRRQRQAFVLSSDEEVSRCGHNDNDGDHDGRKGLDKGKRRALAWASDGDIPASTSGATRRKDTSGVLSSSRKNARSNDDDVEVDIDIVPQELLDEDEYDLPLGDLFDLDIDLDPSRSVNPLGPASAWSSHSRPSRPVSNSVNPISNPSTGVVHSILDALDLNLRTAPITSHIPTPTSHLPARASTTTRGTGGVNATIAIVSPTSLRMRLDHPVMFISDMAERDKEFYLNHWRRGADKGEGEAGKQAGWDLVEEDEEEEEAGERGGKGRGRGPTRQERKRTGRVER
ncbi:hypothetical protein EHS25_001606 [Saitozyma podzolica]|uniref:Uncharacterized protein n=1 Tax=Saitozyma podzolica TaxID=1890683 RepID=A0A427YGR0_9TREE|nr:hypothetical protein EHS25_001606 [Saitozyma podzolica]